MSATRTVRASLVVLGVLVLLGAGSAWGQNASLTLSSIDANWTHILLNGITPIRVTVGNAAGADANLDWSVTNGGTAGLSLSGSDVGLIPGGSQVVSGSFTSSAYDNFLITARATGTSSPGGGLAINSPTTSQLQINVGQANASSGESNSLFNFDVSDALYSLVPAGGSYAGLASKVVFGPSNILGTVGTFLYGYNNTGAPQVISMNWRSRSLVETFDANIPQGTPGTPGTPGSPIAVDEYGLWSDVTSVTGLSGSLFVLQLTYDANSLRLENGHDEKWYADNGYIYLAWLDPNDGLLKNAVLGNIGTPNDVLFMGNGTWHGDDPNDIALGHYGVDSNSHTVWAVLDHTSQFSATPEPATLTLLALAGLGLLRRRNRK
jgi:MYXO-CTERM domain-containing protein